MPGQAARVGLPGEGFRSGSKPERDVSDLVEQQPDGGSEERAGRQLASRISTGEGEATAQRRIEGARADAHGPVNRRSELLPLVVGELAVRETGDLLRRHF